MLQEFLKELVETSPYATMSETGAASTLGPVVLTTTGIKYVKRINAPIRLLKWGFVVTAVAIVTGGTNLVLKLNSYPNAGSASGKTVIDTLTITDPNSAFVVGTAAYRDGFTVSTTSQTPASEQSQAGPLGSTPGTIVSGQGQFTFSAGQMISMEVTTAVTTSGQVEPFIEYVLLPISKPSGYGTTSAGVVSLTEQFTRFAS